MFSLKIVQSIPSAHVGMRGSRVQTIVNELQGEKIDIINWTEDVGSLVVSALAPAEVQKVVLDQENRRSGSSNR